MTVFIRAIAKKNILLRTNKQKWNKVTKMAAKCCTPMNQLAVQTK